MSDCNECSPHSVSLSVFLAQVRRSQEAHVHQRGPGPHRAPGVLLLLPPLRGRLPAWAASQETRGQKGRSSLSSPTSALTSQLLSSRPVPPLRPSTSACPQEAPTALLRNSGCRSPSSAVTTQSAGEFHSAAKIKFLTRDQYSRGLK